LAGKPLENAKYALQISQFIPQGAIRSDLILGLSTS